VIKSVLPFVIMISVIILLFWGFWRGGKGDEKSKERSQPAWRPDALKDATLICAETDYVGTFEGSFHSHVMGRPDQVYRLPSGLYLPVEFKTRERWQVYATDRAQLSLYAFLLRQNGFMTATYGYLIIQNRHTKERHTLQVDLYDDAWVRQTFERYGQIINGAPPLFEFTPKCAGCAHQPRCHMHPDPDQYKMTGG
jgi:CRISPR-associated exonuclease Cas4